MESISILVVDDDTTCLSILAATLKKLKYEVVTVKHAMDALLMLRIKGCKFDLVLSDVHMPDMNGFELQQAIAQEFNLPVVLMSADNGVGIKAQGLKNGAAFFILKPVSAGDLRDLWQFACMKKRVDRAIVEQEMDFNEDEECKKGLYDRKLGGISERSLRKKPKVIWTNALHDKFLEAIRIIGLDRAVPKKILELMNVPGLTRDNVASHLQKYRIFLRRDPEPSCENAHYSSDRKSSNRRFRPTSTSSPGTSPSLLVLQNWISKNKYQDSGLHFPNCESSSCESLPGSRQAMLLSNNKICPKPNMPSCRSFQHQTNYVGYRMSNLKHLTDQSWAGLENQAVKHGNGSIISLPAAGNGFHDKYDQLEGSSVSSHVSAGGQQLSDIIADYQMLLDSSNAPFFSGMENQQEQQQGLYIPVMQESDSLTRNGSNQQQGRAKDLTNSLELTASSQLSYTLASLNEQEDQELIESLISSYQFGEDETSSLDGI